MVTPDTQWFESNLGSNESDTELSLNLKVKDLDENI